MAQKKITDLQLISAFAADSNLPVENATQTYRATGQQVKDYILAAGNVDILGLANNTFAANEVRNLGLAASVASSALTISLKGADGNAPSASNPVKIPFRSSTATTGTPVIRSAVAATTVVIPSTATMGSVNAFPNWVYVYAIDNAGTVELAVAATRLADDGTLYDTTATPANSKTTLYSTTARSGVPVRLLGRVKSTQATAGTWATAPSEISLWPFTVSVKQDEIWLIAGNGYGSTNTKIPKFSTTQRNIGTAMSYNSGTIATLGTEITINEDGVYVALMSFMPGSASDIIAGLSVNSNQLTTSVLSITAGHRLGSTRTNNGTVTSTVAICSPFYGFAGDVVRPHTGGHVNDDALSTFRIMKTG